MAAKEIISSITSKGQITIPVEVRRLLGVSANDKVVFIVEHDEVRLARRGSVILESAGALRSQAPARTAEEMREIAEESIAEATISRSSN